MDPEQLKLPLIDEESTYDRNLNVDPTTEFFDVNDGWGNNDFDYAGGD